MILSIIVDSLYHTRKDRSNRGKFCGVVLRWGLYEMLSSVF